MTPFILLIIVVSGRALSFTSFLGKNRWTINIFIATCISITSSGVSISIPPITCCFIGSCLMSVITSFHVVSSLFGVVSSAFVLLLLSSFLAIVFLHSSLTAISHSSRSSRHMSLTIIAHHSCSACAPSLAHSFA